MNWFTRGNPLAVATLQHMNSKRLPSQQLTDAMHIASKLIDGYRDLDALVAVDGAAEISMAKFMARNRRPPTLARVDGCTVPVRGIEAILAAARLVADTDCLGGGFKNAGFVVQRNALGMPLSVRAVKIDAGFSFNFRGAENILYAVDDRSPHHIQPVLHGIYMVWGYAVGAHEFYRCSGPPILSCG